MMHHARHIMLCLHQKYLSKYKQLQYQKHTQNKCSLQQTSLLTLQTINCYFRDKTIMGNKSNFLTKCLHVVIKVLAVHQFPCSTESLNHFCKKSYLSS